MMDILHAMDRQMELMSPFSVYHFINDPSLKNAGDVLYMPTLAYVGARSTVALLGETWPGFWGMRAHGFDLLKQQSKTLLFTAKDMAKMAVRSTPVIGAAAISVPSAILYEKHVNEPIRAAHGGSGTGSWRGPFASGFGTVV
jgi:hypothetical protein